MNVSLTQQNKILPALLLVLVPSIVYSQNQGIQAKIVNNKTSKPIPFSTVRLFANGKLIGGVVSNLDGDFQLPAKNKITIDSMVVSCIGYRSLRLTLNDLAEDRMNILKLMEGSVRLKEVVVSAGKRLTANKIVRLAIRHLPDNYPQHPYSYISYYRDYQLEQNQYVNLNEAIIEVFDKGFTNNDLLTTQEKLYRYRENRSFPRDPLTIAPYELNKNKFIPGVRLYPFGGNELSILRIHDALRNHQLTTYSFVNVFQNDFVNNHSFKLLDTVYLNDIALYKIGVQSLLSVSGQEHTARGEIYIEQGNYAIHKLSYAAYERKLKKEKLLYAIELEYAKSDAHMYLNYISCNNFFLSKSNEGFSVIEIVFDAEMKAFIIRFNRPPEAKSALHPGNYQFTLDTQGIDFNKIEISAKDDREVFLWVSPQQASMITDPVKIKPGFRNIKDKMGREINEIMYKEVHQFRELFLQKLNPAGTPPGTGAFIDGNLPLKQNKIDSATNSSSYWMNTPLKK